MPYEASIGRDVCRLGLCELTAPNYYHYYPNSTCLDDVADDEVSRGHLVVPRGRADAARGVRLQALKRVERRAS